MKKVVSAAILLLALTSWSCQSQFADILQSVDTLVSKSPYEKGREAYRRKDYRSALREWQPLAEHGHPRAEFYLGVMYQNGRGLPQNHAEASKWYSRAARQNYSRAQYNLGIMYMRGEGVSFNPAHTYKWLSLADMHLPKGKYRDNAERLRDSVRNKMSPAQVAEGQRLARAWMAKHGKN